MSTTSKRCVACVTGLFLMAAAVAPAEAQHGRRGPDAADVIGRDAAGALSGGDPDEPIDPAHAEDLETGDGCPLVRRPVYDIAGRFAGDRLVASC